MVPYMWRITGTCGHQSSSGKSHNASTRRPLAGRGAADCRCQRLRATRRPGLDAQTACSADVRARRQLAAEVVTFGSRQYWRREREVKHRHAVTLALAGWYLMSPPVMRIPRTGSRVNHAAQLRYWKIRGTYPSHSDCEDAIRAALELAKAKPANMPETYVDLSPSLLTEVANSLVCVSDDDSRLSCSSR
jgi:hypothetical protein